MWHEARRQEKAVRNKMVDNVKRQERKKQFYESVRREPEEFMQLHGQKMPIHVDPTIAEAAESPNTLRKWQGDPNILIDRFDVRVHLEQIQEALSKQTKKSILNDDIIELQCEYERYRILVINEFRKVSESNFLSKIATKEFWPVQSNACNASSSTYYKREHEKKKKLTDKRAAIAFAYDDSETHRNSSEGRREQQQSSSSDEYEVDEPDDIVVDPDELTAEQAAVLNKIGTRFCSITSGAFLQLLKLDQKEQTSTAQIKEIDKAKLALSGRHAKADRAVLKRRRAMIIGNLGSATQISEEATTTLLSFLASSEKGDVKEESSSSDSGEEFVKTEFITCFGGEEEKNGNKRAEQKDEDGPNGDEDGGIMHGPILPTQEYRRLLELSRRRSISPESKWNEKMGWSSSTKRRSRSPKRHGSDYGREKNRSGDRDRHRQMRRCRSSSSSRSPPPKRASIGRKVSEYRNEIGRKEIHGSERGGRERRRQEGIKSPNTHFGNGNGREEKGLLTPPKPNTENSTSSDESYSPMPIRSSMSESEKERVERENRKKRIRRTKRTIREQQESWAPVKSSSGQQDEAESRAEKAAKKLRAQMQKTLSKTAAQLKEEEEQRQREMMREKKQREEELLEESRILRQREREKQRAKEGRQSNGRREKEKYNEGHSRRRRHRSSSNS